MRRKYVAYFSILLCFSYLYLCFYLFFRLETKQGKTWVEDVAYKVQRKWQQDGVGQLTKTRCVCDYWTHILGHGSRGELPKQKMDEGMCLFTKEAASAGSKNDVQMMSFWEKIKISYPQFVWTHTGWNQDYKITYHPDQWDMQPLEVFVVLFSHADPGWLSTYKSYARRASTILNHAVDQLTDDPQLTFVWAEVVFLEHWYSEASQKRREQFVRLLSSGRFEVLTGGWVMTDEATAHYGAMLEQLSLGHQWLQRTLNYSAASSWSLDAFGVGATLPYLLRRAGTTGFKGHMVQRVHYSTQQHLARAKQLEFSWNDVWAVPGGGDGLFTHVSPFLSYNMLYSCGPDIQVCCQFDFHKKKCWKWGEFQEPEAITQENIATKAYDLLDQWRKKAQLFKHRFLLAPFGDDFRFETSSEWDKQIKNWKKLIEYMNGRDDMHVVVKFATLSEYFAAVQREPGERASDNPLTFPSLSGDFLVYSDRADQYWSGFYTTRPFLKYMARLLQSEIRAADIQLSLAVGYGRQKGGAGFLEMLQPFFRLLSEARRELALLQHHDTITGTSRKDVITDHLSSIKTALENTWQVQQVSVSVLLQVHHTTEAYSIITTLYEQSDAAKLPTLRVLPPPKHTDPGSPEASLIAVFNPLPQPRNDTVTVLIADPFVTVVDDVTQQPAACQVDLGNGNITATQYEVTFAVSLPALGIARYRILPGKPGGELCPLSEVKVYSRHHHHQLTSIFPVSWLPKSSFSIENQHLSVSYCKCSGLMQSVTDKTSNTPHNVGLSVVTYGTGWLANPLHDKSGAYVFLPDADAQEVDYSDSVVVVTIGPVKQSATTRLQYVSQTVTLYNVTGVKSGGVWLENVVDLRRPSNMELAMRVHTDVRSIHETTGNPQFFTDANGFQMLRRQTLSKLPLQGNFYPMTSQMYIEDQMFRVSVHSAQSHGVASLNKGELEVMLDRTLAQDDWRGLGEGVTDNVPTLSRLVLTIESRTAGPTHQPVASASFPSLAAHLTSLHLQHPVLPYQLTPTLNTRLAFAPFAPIADSSGWPCDVHLLNLQHSGSLDVDSEPLLLLHRLGTDCDYEEVYTRHCRMAPYGKVDYKRLFSRLRIKSIVETSLTGTSDKSIKIEDSVHIPPMEIKAYRINLTT